MAAQRWPAALALSGRCKKAEPRSPQPWLTAGIAYNHLNNPLAAAAALEVATRRDPTLYWAWLNLGEANLKLSRLQPALASYAHVLSERPHDPAALLGAGIAEARLGAPTAAVGYLQQATEASPKVARAWLWLGMERSVLGQWQPAAESLAKAASLSPGEVATWYQLGRASYGAGDGQAVARVFPIVVQLDPVLASRYSDWFLNPSLDRMTLPKLAGWQALSPPLKGLVLETTALHGSASARAVLQAVAAKHEPAAEYALGLYQEAARHETKAAQGWFDAAVAGGSVSAAAALAEPFVHAVLHGSDDETVSGFLAAAAGGGNSEAEALATAYAGGHEGFPRDAGLAQFWRARAARSRLAKPPLQPPALSPFGVHLAALTLPASSAPAGDVAASRATAPISAATFEAGARRLDDEQLMELLRLRIALVGDGGTAACAALWGGNDRPAVSAAVKRLPEPEQLAWAQALASIAKAARAGGTPVATPSAAAAAAQADLLDALSPAEQIALAAVDANVSAAADPVVACGAAHIYYGAMTRLAQADQITLMRVSLTQ